MKMKKLRRRRINAHGAATRTHLYLKLRRLGVIPYDGGRLVRNEIINLLRDEEDIAPERT